MVRARLKSEIGRKVALAREDSSLTRTVGRDAVVVAGCKGLASVVKAVLTGEQNDGYPSCS